MRLQAAEALVALGEQREEIKTKIDQQVEQHIKSLLSELAGLKSHSNPKEPKMKRPLPHLKLARLQLRLR